MNDLSNQRRRPDGKFGPAIVPKASEDSVASAAVSAAADSGGPVASRGPNPLSTGPVKVSGMIDTYLRDDSEYRDYDDDVDVATEVLQDFLCDLRHHADEHGFGGTTVDEAIVGTHDIWAEENTEHNGVKPMWDHVTAGDLDPSGPLRSDGLYDPDNTNSDRAERAGLAFDTYEHGSVLTREERLRDMLTDARHWAVLHGADFPEAARASGEHYRYEVANEHADWVEQDDSLVGLEQVDEIASLEQNGRAWATPGQVSQALVNGWSDTHLIEAHERGRSFSDAVRSDR